MIHPRYHIRAAANLAGDLLSTASAFFAAWWLRFETGWIPLVREVPEMGRYLELLPVIAVMWPATFYFQGLYRVRPGRSRVDEALSVLVAALLAGILLSGFCAWYRPPLAPGSSETFTYSRTFLGLFIAVDVILVILARLAIGRAAERRLVRGHNLQRILVVGAGRLGSELAGKLAAHRELGFEVVGFLDDDPGKAGSRPAGVPVIGTTDELERVLQEEAIAQVYVALPLDAYRTTMWVLETVGRECVEVRLVPDLLQYAALKASLEDVDGTPVINLSQVPLQGWHSLVKRSMDLMLSAAALVALTVVPVLPIIALAIWLEDRGAVLYRQERMGLDGRPFEILKFRSMEANAEATTGPVMATPDDPRRTRVGSWLRRWSLDELPQLWNVLKGEMSLVGPRPERPPFVQELKRKLPQYMLRHKVKSGMTGWAQVHGWRGATSIPKRLQYDLYYIENWSLKLDLKILWMTLRSGLRHNAY